MLKTQIALFLARNWKKVIPIVLGIIFFPFLIIALMVSLTQSLSIEDDTAQLYMRISEEVGNENGVYLDYSQLIGIDAVRYAQDFSKSTESNIRELADKFIKSESTTIETNLTNYKITASKVSQELDWRLVVQVDSVLSGEGLKADDIAHIEGLVNQFLKEDGLKTIYDVLAENGKTSAEIPEKYKNLDAIVEKTTNTTEICSVKTLDEVALELNFSQEDIEIAKSLASKALEMFGSGGGVEFTGSQSEFILSIVPGAREGFEKYGVFPSVTIAQAILESGWGKSGLATQSNNLFGIKADSRWQGPKVNMRTAEYTSSSNKYYINADFRKYESFNHSVVDHGKFLSDNPRYDKHGVFTAQNPRQQAEALKRAGYATDPNYPNLIMDIVNKYNLAQYDAKEFSLESPSINGLEYTQSNSKIPLMLQTDPKWASKPYGSSTIKVSGCGTTSLAMVISALSGQTVTPVEVSNWASPKYYVPGSGSAWSIFDGASKKWGLNVKQINKRDPQAILNHLKQGLPIITSLGKGDFTRNGHIIVLTGVTADGKITVNDPNSAERSKKTWDLSLIISQSSKKGNAPFWAFSK